MGERDITVIPKESGQFGFFPNGSADQVVPMEELDVYTKNQLPLKAMKEAGKIVIDSHNGGHLNFNDAWFIEHCIPYLQ